MLHQPATLQRSPTSAWDILGAPGFTGFWFLCFTLRYLTLIMPCSETTALINTSCTRVQCGLMLFSGFCFRDLEPATRRWDSCTTRQLFSQFFHSWCRGHYSRSTFSTQLKYLQLLTTLGNPWKQSVISLWLSQIGLVATATLASSWSLMFAMLFRWLSQWTEESRARALGTT